MKLVRDYIDRVPWDVEDAKDRLDHVVFNSEEHRDLLIKKLIEEVGELLEAMYENRVTKIEEESGDVYEVLLGILFTFANTKATEVEQRLQLIAHTKRVERGGFFNARVYRH